MIKNHQEEIEYLKKKNGKLMKKLRERAQTPKKFSLKKILFVSITALMFLEGYRSRFFKDEGAST